MFFLSNLKIWFIKTFEKGLLKPSKMPNCSIVWGTIFPKGLLIWHLYNFANINYISAMTVQLSVEPVHMTAVWSSEDLKNKLKM